MRTSTIARGGALLTAAILAITLSGGPASAHDSGQGVAGTSPAPANAHARAKHAPAAKFHFGSAKPGQSVTPPHVTLVKASSTVLYAPGGSSIDVDVSGTGDDSIIDHIDLNLTVDGEHVGAYTVYSDDIGEYLNIPNSVGSGKAKITSEKIYYTEDPDTHVTPPPTTDGTDSNTFYVRRATGSMATNVGSDFALWAVVGHSSINFHANKWVIFKPSTETLVPMQSIKLQYRKHHHWYTLKTIKLDSNGTGTYKKSRGTAYRYRLYYGTTDSIYGSYTDATDSF